MAVFLLRDLCQLRARARTIYTCATVRLIGVVARLRCGIHSGHLFEAFRSRSWEINLKWTSEELFIPQKLEKRGVVLSSTPNEIHSLSASRAKFNIFTAVVEAFPVAIRPQIIQFRDYVFPRGRFFGGCNVDKKGLVWRASKRAEEVEKVFFACWTR